MLFKELTMAVLLTYGLMSVALLLLCVVTYSYARSTRKQVRCTGCGEVVRMEHDRVSNCPSCGASL